MVVVSYINSFSSFQRAVLKSIFVWVCVCIYYNVWLENNMSMSKGSTKMILIQNQDRSMITIKLCHVKISVDASTFPGSNRLHSVAFFYDSMNRTCEKKIHFYLKENLLVQIERGIHVRWNKETEFPLLVKSRVLFRRSLSLSTSLSLSHSSVPFGNISLWEH